MSIQSTGKVVQIVASLDDTHTSVSIISPGDFGGLQLHGKGRAKRMKGDERIPEVGLGLALARALRHYADTEERAANALMERRAAEAAAQREPVEPGIPDLTEVVVAEDPEE